jgi:2-hydroxychromene-2-carboxylate isomerase
MKLFVFEHVLRDWSSGMVVIAANDLEQAHEIAEAEYSWSFKDDHGWAEPTAVYDVAEQLIKVGVRHRVYGGS